MQLVMPKLLGKINDGKNAVDHYFEYVLCCCCVVVRCVCVSDFVVYSAISIVINWVVEA